jgi:hypothetical protein
MIQQQHYQARAIQPVLPKVIGKFNAANVLELEPHMVLAPDVHPNCLRNGGGRCSTLSVDEFQHVHVARLLEPGVLMVNHRMEKLDPTEENPSIRLACWKVANPKDIAARPFGMKEHLHLARNKHSFTTKVPTNLGIWNCKEITSYRIPFIKSWLKIDPMLVTGSGVLTFDHLCHDNECYNPFHHDITHVTVNQS